MTKTDNIYVLLSKMHDAIVRAKVKEDTINNSDKNILFKNNEDEINYFKEKIVREEEKRKIKDG